MTDNPTPKNIDDELNTEIIEGTDDNFMLTTIDNPYNPKTDYALWQRFDSENGHDTAEYIARLISMEEDFNVEDSFKLNMLTSKVIEEILENDTLGIYRLV